MANYTRVGLSATEISELKRDWKEQSWRLKFLKPPRGGMKLPATDTTRITSIDSSTNPSPLYPINTEGGRYKKIIHDNLLNRTFILHNEEPNENTNAVVSIINHNLDTADPDYIEKINKNTSSGWSTNYTVGTARDMAYNGDRNELAISFDGTGTLYPPALFIINTQKYAAELLLNTCATLDDNPDYLNCTIYAAAANVTGVAGSYIPFVRYYVGRWWVWTAIKSTYAAPNSFFHHLGSFLAGTGTYTFYAQFGYSPRFDGENAAGTIFAASVRCPLNTARTYPIAVGNSPADGIDKQWGDPVNMFNNVTAFDVQGGGTAGKIIIGTTPQSLDFWVNQFGTEACVFRIDIATMLSGYTSPAVIATGALEIEASYDPTPPAHYFVTGGTVTATVTLPTAIRGYGRIKITQAHTGSRAGVDCGERLRVQSQFGTCNIGSVAKSGVDLQPDWHLAFPVDGDGTVKIGIGYDVESELTTFKLIWGYNIYEWLPGLEDCLGVHSTAPIVQSDDANRLTLGAFTFEGATWNLIRYLFPVEKYTQIQAGISYSAANGKYGFPVLREGAPPDAADGLGLWTHSGTALKRNTVAASDLSYDYIGLIERLDDEYIALACSDAGEDNLAVQFFRIANDTFLADVFTAALGYSTCSAAGVWVDPDAMTVGFVTYLLTGGGTAGEIWFWEAETLDADTDFRRDPRYWWDGSNADAIIGGDGTHVADVMGQLATIYSPSLSEAKGQASNEFSFDVSGIDYLPLVESVLNENVDFPGTYDGLLRDGTRFIAEAGVLTTDGVRTWHSEGLYYILRAPNRASMAIGDQTVTGMGIIALAVTHAIYRGVHEPDITEYIAVALTTTDDLTYYYDSGGVVTDWLDHPPPIIYVDGVEAENYEIVLNAGTVTFNTAQTGSAITATFSAYDPGTNEAEDIIICILEYPQELNGAGINESFFTDIIIGETLTTTDNLTYSFTKNNIYTGATQNKIYVDAVEKTAGVDFTWNYRDGSATFGVSQVGHVVTGDCKYYTIQKSGVTLGRIRFTPKEQSDAHTCIEEVCRRVSPNYVLFERRDGKIAVEFVTQAAAGAEDIEITDADIVIRDIGAEPAYENLATSVISYGQAELDQLPNKCFGKTVTDNWTIEMTGIGQPGWHGGVDVQCVTDGDPNTQATTGYGRWDEGTYAVQAYLFATGQAGVPCLTVDMGEVLEIETLILARGSQVATEGDAGTICQFSIWVSQDGAGYENIVATFELPPGQNLQFEAGTAFDDGLTFRYIQVRCHALGLYVWGKNGGHTDSQMGISEIQAYTSKQIEGLATLQIEDPAADYYDEYGLLDRYGVRTVLARNGQPDPALDTQAKADADAGFCLMEFVRLLSRLTLNFPWLPAVPKFSTIKITNALTGVSASFFVESRSGGQDGYSLTGTTLP